MTTIAERNRAIKRALAQAFAPHKVSVTGSRGTGYGWIRASIDYAPRNGSERQDLYSKVQRLAIAAAKDCGSYIGTFYSDDGYNTQHAKINIDFLPTRSDRWE